MDFFLKVGFIWCFRELHVRKFRKFSPNHFNDKKIDFYEQKTDVSLGLNKFFFDAQGLRYVCLYAASSGYVKSFRRLTSGSRVSVVSLEIPGIVVSLEIPVFRIFLVKT